MGRLLFFFYTSALLAFSPFIAAYLLLRPGRRARRLRGLKERLGFVSSLSGPGPSGRLWVHAVSVGEVGVAAALLPEFRRRFPDLRIVLSTVTETGREAASRLDDLEALFYLPFDLPFAVKMVLDRIRPTAFVLVETEVWPNLIRGASRRGIPVAVVNGRVTERSFRRYMKLRFFFGRVLDTLKGAAVREEIDASRFRALGVPLVEVTGNVKYDSPAPALPEGGTGAKKRFGLSGAEPIVVAGSTHPGEEAAIARAVSALREEYPRLGLLLAPRHLDRLAEAEAALRDSGLDPLRWSRCRDADGPREAEGGVVILDVMGLLPEAYACATVAFIGGSLTPHGGQNPIEAAIWKVPLVYGSHMTNFREVASGLEEAGGAVRVQREEGLAGAIGAWLADSAARAAAGAAACAVVEAHRGAARRSVDFLERVLGLPPGGGT